ncbi:pyruvate:ferredoxin (flavodoxin) oxidoreductase [Acidaminococcus timonensis]|jgi:pyruvate-ferredoxin/flavodoxin oxidoreductase|uniref:pyruvate:ferredoxin (flavodoxin) oxidoreductase n=2 Tax=Acidaminococcus timonensis TaxID=1871002 RepID=UPI003A5BA109
MKKMKTMDGNTAAAYTSYAFTEVAAIYPITPSSPMAEVSDEWASHGKKNIFGRPVQIMEMQSEAGASGAVHGSLASGALTTTYTASQGLLLMIPNMYKIAGELLPAVFDVAARCVATSSLNIFGDHSDVMATRQTGFAMLAESGVQEVMDLTAVAHLSAIKGHVPFVNFFDGFRTSHEIQKIELLDYEDLKKLVDYDELKKFREHALNPDHPVIRGTNQNPDIDFQTREAVNKYYLALPEIVEGYMNEINKLTGRDYKLFNYTGAPDAENVVVIMGSGAQTVEEVVKILVGQGEKVGVLNVHLYRPFSAKHFFAAMPKTVKRIAVMDRTKEPGSNGEPLYLDVRDIYYNKADRPLIVGGRYGLGSKEFYPGDVLAIFDNLKAAEPKDHFTVGIVDDVTNTSLPREKTLDITPKGTVSCKFWGLGSDGTVGANKMAIKIIGDKTDKYAQGYFAYDSKKSGGITVSHLRFGDTPIHMPFLINFADYVAVHNPSYVHRYNVANGLKKGGVFLLNCPWSGEELEKELPGQLKKYLAVNNIQFYTIDAVKIASQIGLGGRINMIMQAAFFKLANVIPVEDAVKYLKESIVTSYGKKGQKVVDMNNAAVDQGVNAIVKVDVPASWANCEYEPLYKKIGNDFYDNIMIPMTEQEGDSLPVSALMGQADGTFPSGTAAFEKRGIAINVPEWNIENCIQCNQCALMCPHAAIRPFLLTDEELKNAPEGLKAKPALGAKGLNFCITVSPMDCQGCSNCVDACPGMKGNKALAMKPFATQEGRAPIWDYCVKEVSPKQNPMKTSTIKGSQFEQPLLEFSGACAGCGETPYAKLVTQLVGDRMMIANATGCSSIWAAAAPSMPYTTNHKGHGPAWANSLFEDNAEYGLGMYLGVKAVRDRLVDEMKAAEAVASDDLKAAMEDWIANKDEGEGSRARAEKLVELLEAEKAGKPELEKLYENKQFFVKRSQWIFGGDGWSYDIGYGGVDHVLASGDDVNIMVFDTEVYSNTGGQSSKSTPEAAVAQFAASGKRTKKKDLGMMAMTYGYVYVAQINLGADKNQALKAIREAEAYHGPSLIICYSPCINHGIKRGMQHSFLEAKAAVDCGYWSCFRYNPELKKEGKKSFFLDSTKTPNFDEFENFLKGEVRYASLAKGFPDIAEDLYAKTKKDAEERLAGYVKLDAEDK